MKNIYKLVTKVLLFVVTLGIILPMLPEIKAVAGGSTASYVSIDSLDDEEIINYYYFKDMDPRPFMPMKGQSYEFTITPDIDDSVIENVKVEADESIVKVSEITDDVYVDGEKEYKQKKVTLTFIGDVGIVSNFKMTWTVSNARTEETDDNTFEPEFTIADKDNKAIYLESYPTKVIAENMHDLDYTCSIESFGYSAEDEEMSENVNYVIAKIGDKVDYFFYELNLYDGNGEAIHQLSEYVEAQVPVPVEYKNAEGKIETDASFQVFRIDDDGSLIPCVTEGMDDRYVVHFRTNHFSTYVIAMLDEETFNKYNSEAESLEADFIAAQEQETQTEAVTDETTTAVSDVTNVDEEATNTTTESDTESSVDIIVVVVIVAVCVVIAAGAVIIIKKRKALTKGKH